MQTPANTRFFERQDRARRSTARLLVCFFFAVVGTALLFYLPVAIAIASIKIGSAPLTFQNFIEYGWNARAFAYVFGGVLIFLAGASLAKYLTLAGTSGSAIAKSLGGRRISPDTSAADERRLLNVVQEMSLASGVPVPAVFVLENEQSINAFAAGTRLNNAAVAVSRGALDKLSRDELQGVIGHEFSHILNGDMRLNIQLVGWVFGLTLLHTIGRVVLYVSGSVRGSSKTKEARLLLMFLGLIVYVIGAIGSFFASIILAGISRSREHLADASSAQFTRNPVALANALARIGGDQFGSKISSPHAGEYAHLFFASGVSSLFATHPPLEKRIRELNPAWDGHWLPAATPQNFHENSNAGNDGNNSAGGVNATPIPHAFYGLTQTANGAKALVYLMLMTDSPSADNVEQAKIIRHTEPPELYSSLEKLWEELATFPHGERVSAVLLAAPALRELDSSARKNFCETLDKLAAADGKISLFELCILCAVRGILMPDGNATFSARQLRSEAEMLLNIFLNQNSPSPQEKRMALLRSALSRQTAFPQDLAILSPQKTLSLFDIEKAFSRLRRTELPVRRDLLTAAETIARGDGKISATEADLLRAFAVALDCPTPQI